MRPFPSKRWSGIPAGLTRFKSFFAQPNWTPATVIATAVSLASLCLSSVVGYAQFYKVTRGEIAVVSWGKAIEDDKGQLVTKVTAIVSNTGDEQFMLLSADSRALVPNAAADERADQTWDRRTGKWKAEGAEQVVVEPGKMKTVNVYVPTTMGLRKLNFDSELQAKLRDPECGDAPHYTVVVDALIVGVDGKYRGGNSPKLCFYVDRDGKLPKVRRFTTSRAGPFSVLPFESYTF